MGKGADVGGEVSGVEEGVSDLRRLTLMEASVEVGGFWAM